MSFSSSLLLVDEEEEDNKKSKNASSSSSLLLERKREKMLDRLRETERLRKQKRDASRREHDAKHADPTENVETFAKAFKEVVEDIERDIIGGSAAGRRVERTEEENNDEENALTKIAVLRERVAKSAYFLPKFDAEKSMKTCDALEKKAREGGAKAEASGKKTKKFSFAAKMVKKKTGDEKDSRSSASASSSATVIEMLQ